MKFTEIPRRVQPLLAPPDPIVIHHLIKYIHLVIPNVQNCSKAADIKHKSNMLSVLSSADAPEGRRTACYDIEVEIVSGSSLSILLMTAFAFILWTG